MRPTPRLCVLLALFAGVAVFLQFRPVHDLDIFWQVRLGEVILDRGTLVTAEPFSATHAGDRLPPLCWLSQVVYAGLYRLGGWLVLHRLDALMLAGALALAASAARPTAPGVLLIAGALALMVVVPHVGLRPQTWAALGFSATVWLASGAMPTGRSLVLAVPLFVLWQNLHPSVGIAALYLAVLAGCGWLRRLRGQVPAPWRLTAMTVAAGAAVFATPLGADLLRVSADNARLCLKLQVTEWLPVWHPATWPASATTWLALVVSVLLLARAGRRARLEDVAVLIALGGATILTYRLGLFWALAMVPAWADWLSEPVQMASAEQPPGLLATVAYSLLAAGAALAIAAPFHPPVFPESRPFDGVERLRELGVRGPIYNHAPWGGILIWAGYPDWRVAYDGRYYLFSPEEWDRYQQAARGDVPLAELEQTHRPAAFFLHPGAEPLLVERLRHSEHWREVYADNLSAVFLPAGPRSNDRR